MKYKITLEFEILVLDQDQTRCLAIDHFNGNFCQHLIKDWGEYRCKLFDESVDTSEDDSFGYGFKRCKQCLDATKE